MLDNSRDKVSQVRGSAPRSRQSDAVRQRLTHFDSSGRPRDLPKIELGTAEKEGKKPHEPAPVTCPGAKRAVKVPANKSPPPIDLTGAKAVPRDCVVEAIPSPPARFGRIGDNRAVAAGGGSSPPGPRSPI